MIRYDEKQINDIILNILRKREIAVEEENGNLKIDSIGTVQLIVDIENTFSIVIPIEALTMENFQNLTLICNVVKKLI